MPNPRRLSHPSLSVIVGVVIIASGGCVPDMGTLDAAPQPQPAESLVAADWPERGTDSDPERVEQAATRAIGSYLTATDLITSEGGQNPQRMAAFTTGDWFPQEAEAFARYRTDGLRTLGTTRLDTLVVLSLWAPVSGGVAVDVVACVDARWLWLVPEDAPDPPEGLLEWLMLGRDVAEVDDDEFDRWSEFIDTHEPRPGTRDPVVFWLVGPHLDQLTIDGTLNWEGVHTCHPTATD